MIVLFCFFFLKTDWYFSNSSSDCTNFNPTVKLAMPTGTPTYEANAEIETQPLRAEVKFLKMFKVI